MENNRLRRLIKKTNHKSQKSLSSNNQIKIKEPLTTNLSDNIILLKKIFHNCSDIVFREIVLEN
ncbi:hypothetical protein QFZ31_001062 [Neobacillus niacini]|uniref:hypothetical protein n=1 Tax=Neobacillus driksii TaxID=3035913 RepID=UPI00277F189F|nr:hypothetical protein [Neobacillus niacini]MDQ0971184.1 hypothetical protein [Neobacillus niacini]